MLRHFSNSIILVTICHALWNTLVYTFFGFGKTFGSWGIKKYFLFDPERGLLGVLLQTVVVFIFIYLIHMKRKKPLIPFFVFFKIA